MGDRIWQTNHLGIFSAFQVSYKNALYKSTVISPSHPGPLSLLPSAGREMSTSQSAVMLCGWGVKAGMVILFVGKRVGCR